MQTVKLLIDLKLKILQNLSLWKINMLFANEYDDYNSHSLGFSGLFSNFITETTYLEWEIGKCSGDEEYSLKGL